MCIIILVSMSYMFHNEAVGFTCFVIWLYSIPNFHIFIFFSIFIHSFAYSPCLFLITHFPQCYLVKKGDARFSFEHQLYKVINNTFIYIYRPIIIIITNYISFLIAIFLLLPVPPSFKLFSLFWKLESRFPHLGFEISSNLHSPPTKLHLPLLVSIKLQSH